MSIEYFVIPMNVQRCQREETDKYLEYLRNFRHDVAITEAEKDRIVNEYRQRADEEAYRKREELKKQKKDMEKVIRYYFYKNVFDISVNMNNSSGSMTSP